MMLAGLSACAPLTAPRSSSSRISASSATSSSSLDALRTRIGVRFAVRVGIFSFDCPLGPPVVGGESRCGGAKGSRQSVTAVGFRSSFILVRRKSWNESGGRNE
ncbi:unnamed protein product [Musa textilis]